MDSDNILSILASLGNGSQPGAPPANVMQAAAPQPAPVPVAPPAPPPEAAAPVAPAPVEHPAKRRSLLDTIGRISDVLAKVGGADALYQPTLDAREDRTLKLGDHDRTVTSDNLKIATDRFDLGNKTNTRLSMAARGAKAILTANPQADPQAVWHAISQQMQLAPDEIEHVSTAIQSNPGFLDGLIAGGTDPKLDQSRYGGSVVYGVNKDGKLVAYQPSLSDDPARNVLPDDITPIDPPKTVDTGNSQVMYGTRSGKPTRIIPKGVSPDQANRSQTAITIAGMPARSKPAASTAGTGNLGTANMLLDNIERGFTDLHGLKALPGEGGSAVGKLEGIIGRTALGQKVGEQLNNPSAQKRLSIEKDINSLQSEMVKSLPASATRTKFEQEIQRKRMPDPARMSYETARNVIADLRATFAQAQKDAAAELATKSPGKGSTPVVRPRAQPKSGWTIVKVQ